LRIIRELLDFKPEKKNTDISGALKYFNNVIKKRSVAFVISDFIDKNFEDALRIANRKHDVVALRTYDKRETELPSMGLIKMKDAESGNETWVDTSDAETRSSYKKWWLDTEKQLNETFKKSGVDYVYLRTDEDYVRPLLNLFKRR